MFEVVCERLDGKSLSSANVNVPRQPDILRQTSSQQNGIVTSSLRQLSSLGEESSDKPPFRSMSGSSYMPLHLCTPCTSSSTIFCSSFSSTYETSEIERLQSKGEPFTWNANCYSAAAFALALAQSEELAIKGS